MNLVQIVFSPTGGTQKVVDTMSAGFADNIKKVDLSDAAADFASISLDKENVALIAVPSFGGRIPALAAERLAQIQGNHARAVIVVVYGNRAYEDTMVELHDIATQCGFRVIAAVSAVAEHSIMHQYAAGRPDKQDALELKGFMKKISEKLLSDDEGSFAIPGNRPYKKAGSVPLVPKANGSCTSCGLCAENCPAQAIRKETPQITDKSKCISCMRCVAYCPQSARKVNSAMVSVAAMAIKSACSSRKSNELFL